MKKNAKSSSLAPPTYPHMPPFFPQGPARQTFLGTSHKLPQQPDPEQRRIRECCQLHTSMRRGPKLSRSSGLLPHCPGYQEITQLLIPGARSLPNRLATLSLHSPIPTLTIYLGTEHAPCREYLLCENALKGMSFILVPWLWPRTSLFFPWWSSETCCWGRCPHSPQALIRVIQLCADLCLEASSLSPCHLSPKLREEDWIVPGVYISMRSFPLSIKSCVSTHMPLRSIGPGKKVRSSQKSLDSFTL